MRSTDARILSGSGREDLPRSVPGTGSGASPPVDFLWPVRVYYEDTDAGGVVYHSRYLQFMERARTEWLRAAGFEQDQLRVQWGLLFVVHSMQIQWLRPARFNECLEVSCRDVRCGWVRLELHQEILRAGQPLLQAQVRLACVDADRLVPMAMPADLRAVLRSLSACGAA
jgi:acyl-CoA thioester hydrolase